MFTSRMLFTAVLFLLPIAVAAFDWSLLVAAFAVLLMLLWHNNAKEESCLSSRTTHSDRKQYNLHQES